MPANSQRDRAVDVVHVSVDAQDKTRRQSKCKNNGKKKCGIEVFYVALHNYTPESTRLVPQLFRRRTFPDSN